MKIIVCSDAFFVWIDLRIDSLTFISIVSWAQLDILSII